MSYSKYNYSSMKSESFFKEDINQQMDAAFGQVDTTRVEQMEISRKLLERKHNAQLKERERLVAKYGEDHPRVKALETRILYNQVVLPSMGTAIEHSQINTGPYSSNSWRNQPLF